MKNKTKNRLIKKRKGRKTKKMKGGDGWDPFTEISIGLPGVGSVGKCQSKQYYDPKYGWLNQTCYQINGNKVYKTQYPAVSANGAADGSANGAAAKPWYQFWPDSSKANGATTKSWYQFW